MRDAADDGAPRRGARGRLLFLIPLGIVAALGGLALGLLTREGYDPNAIPSVLVGRAAPATELPPVPGIDSPGLADADLRAGTVLVNVFASWCVPCRAEHATLVELAEERGLTVHGIAYKDKPEDTAAFIAELGNPYDRIGMDADGRAAIDWGLTGVPETFVVADGVVRFRAQGPLTNPGMRDGVLAAVEAAR